MTAIKRRNNSQQPEQAQSCVVGIDQSYSGFAVVALSNDLTATVQRKAFPLAKYGDGVDRRLTMGRWLMEVLTGLPPIKHVAMEGYAYAAKGDAVTKMGELGATVKDALRLHPSLPSPICYPTIVTPGSLKKFATGSGAAKKAEILKAVYQKWGFDTNDDNEADAYTVARLAHLLVYGGEPSKYETEVLQNLRRHTECRES